jgi:Integrase core domain
MEGVGLDTIEEANKDLTDWLIKYNSVRPHATLNHQTPLEFAEEQFFKKAWAHGTVKTRTAQHVRYHSLVEQVKTKRDNGWLPISHTADTWMNECTAPFVRVQDSPGV